MQKSYFLVMLFCLVFAVLAARAPLYIPRIAYVFLLPLAAMFVSFLFSFAQFSVFHLSVLIKPCLLFIFVCCFYSLLRQAVSAEHSYGLQRTLEIILVLQIVLVALQIIFGDASWLKVISFRQVYEGLTFRAPGSFDWVYITCYFLTFFLSVYLAELFSGQRKFKALVYVFLILLVIFLAQSKTGYAATVFALVYFLFLSVVLRLGITSRISLVLVATAALLVAALVYFEIRVEYIFNFIELLQSGKLDASTDTRKAQTLLALKEGLEHWHRGSPAALEGVIIENTYLDYLFRYGIAGGAAILLVIFILYFYSFSVLFQARVLFVRGRAHFYLFQLALGCHVSMFTVFFYALSGTPLDAYRSAVWSSFLVGLMAWLQVVLQRSAAAEVVPEFTSARSRVKGLSAPGR